MRNLIADPEEINIHFTAIKEHLDISTFKELENRLNDYDYDNALKTLKGIMEEMEKRDLGIGGFRDYGIEELKSAEYL